MCVELNFRSCETQVTLQRSDTSKDGLKELAALLYTEGRVEGKGEQIGAPGSSKRINRVDSGKPSLNILVFVFLVKTYNF